uniref:Uncharacterized protein n=1 Tax=Arundo donax TaxID=35708 RepID=A0A0A8XR27_ARUDO
MHTAYGCIHKTAYMYCYVMDKYSTYIYCLCNGGE